MEEDALDYIYDHTTTEEPCLDFVPPVSQYVRDTPKVGRNSPCPCGSRRKYKRCCMNKSMDEGDAAE